MMEGVHIFSLSYFCMILEAVFKTYTPTSIYLLCVSSCIDFKTFKKISSPVAMCMTLVIQWSLYVKTTHGTKKMCILQVVLK